MADTRIVYTIETKRCTAMTSVIVILEKESKIQNGIKSVTSKNFRNFD